MQQVTNAKPASGTSLSRKSFPRPMLDFWNTPDRELVSLVKKMITIASQEAKEAESKSDTARSGLLNMALGFSTQKLRLVTDGAVTGSDVGGEMRQALNVLLNTIYR